MPDLGLGRLRSTGRLLEVEPTQLRFTLNEAGDFLRLGRHVQLPPEALAQLHSRTEGWVAGLWLASLALTERQRPTQRADEERPTDFIARFSGSNAAIADYLADDVLSRQPPDVRDFLLRTGILGTLSAGVCNALLDRHDSQRMLEELERANLFIVPLDKARCLSLPRPVLGIPARPAQARPTDGTRSPAPRRGTVVPA